MNQNTLPTSAHPNHAPRPKRSFSKWMKTFAKYLCVVVGLATAWFVASRFWLIHTHADKTTFDFYQITHRGSVHPDDHTWLLLEQWSDRLTDKYYSPTSSYRSVSIHKYVNQNEAILSEFEHWYRDETVKYKLEPYQNIGNRSRVPKHYTTDFSEKLAALGKLFLAKSYSAYLQQDQEGAEKWLNYTFDFNQYLLTNPSGKLWWASEQIMVDMAVILLNPEARSLLALIPAEKLPTSKEYKQKMIIDNWEGVIDYLDYFDRNLLKYDNIFYKFQTDFWIIFGYLNMNNTKLIAMEQLYCEQSQLLLSGSLQELENHIYQQIEDNHQKTKTNIFNTIGYRLFATDVFHSGVLLNRDLIMLTDIIRLHHYLETHPDHGSTDSIQQAIDELGLIDSYTGEHYQVDETGQALIDFYKTQKSEYVFSKGLADRKNSRWKQLQDWHLVKREQIGQTNK